MNQAGVSQCDHLEVQFPMGKGLRCLAKLLQIQDILNFFKVQLKPSSLFCHEPKLRFVIQTSELRLVRYKQVRYKKKLGVLEGSCQTAHVRWANIAVIFYRYVEKKLSLISLS